MDRKREFVQHVLNHLEDGGFIAGWERAKRRARHDYTVRLNSGRIAVIDLKGCLDGNNTTISSGRPTPTSSSSGASAPTSAPIRSGTPGLGSIAGSAPR